MGTAKDDADYYMHRIVVLTDFGLEYELSKDDKERLANYKAKLRIAEKNELRSNQNEQSN